MAPLVPLGYAYVSWCSFAGSVAKCLRCAVDVVRTVHKYVRNAKARQRCVFARQGSSPTYVPSSAGSLAFLGVLL